jgi:hypothetical protein
MRFDEGSADCQVLTYKDGLLSPLGHDLVLGVTRFTIEVEGDRVEASFAADSLRVLSGSGGAVAEVLTEHAPCRLARLGFPDCFGESGDYEAIFSKMKINTQDVIATARQIAQKKTHL